MKSFHIWLFLLAFRLFSALIVISWFVPDEIYQSAEVAHHLVFGTGHLSWEWTKALRSYLHPLSIASVFKVLELLGLSDAPVLIYQLPRVLHAVLFSIGDYFMFDLCVRLCHTRLIANYAFLSYVSCWFLFYCSPRTLSNSVETSLTLIALHWYPFEIGKFRRSTWPYIAIGVVTIVIRPTVGLLWLVFGLHHLVRAAQPIRLLITATTITVIVLAVTTTIDSYAYGRPVFPIWNFLVFNVIDGGSANFGVHPWHWYITDGLPSVLTIQLIPIFAGILFGGFLRPSMLPFYASTFYVLFHSFLPHKEQRFLLPVIPLLCIYTGVAIYKLRANRTIAIVIMVVSNAAIALFTARAHQIGPYAAVQHLIDLGTRPTVAALMPCYSLPGHSFHHHELRQLRQLDCTPDLMGGTGVVDEADAFHNDPLDWLATNFDYRPFSRILMYEKTYRNVSSWFSSHRVCARIFHSYFLTSSREDKYIVVLCRD